jgi:predicted lipoprotein with Yx(FWY)xxD motif
MQTLVNRARTGSGRLILTAAASLALAGGSLSVAAFSGAAAASATPVSGAPAHLVAAHPAAGRSAVVVKEVRRRHFGKILVTLRGAALYYLPSGSCTGQCLAIWPRLVMPRGKTVPKGANCLGTARFGTHHRLQVTYRKHRLYTFVNDSGGSVNGNGVAGFKVAKVLRSC